jgi:hypothetical protein
MSQRPLEQEVDLDHDFHVIEFYPDLFLSLAVLSAEKRLPQIRQSFQPLKRRPDCVAHFLKFHCGHSFTDFMRNQSAKVLMLGLRNSWFSIPSLLGEHQLSSRPLNCLLREHLPIKRVSLLESGNDVMLNSLVNHGTTPQFQSLHLPQKECFTPPRLSRGVMSRDLRKVELALTTPEQLIRGE